MPQMTPQDQDAMQRVVMAAQRIMYDKQIFPRFAQAMTKSGPLPFKLATEAAGLLKMVQDRAKGQIPKRLLIPAGMMIMVEMGDFMEKSKLAKPNEQDVQEAMKLLIDMIPQIFKGKPGQQPPQQPGAPAPQAQPPAPPQAGLINQMGA